MKIKMKMQKNLMKSESLNSMNLLKKIKKWFNKMKLKAMISKKMYKIY